MEKVTIRMLPDDEYYPALLRKYRYPNVDTVKKECEYYYDSVRVTEEQWSDPKFMWGMMMRSLAKELTNVERSIKWWKK